jgi:hypothetical protein
MFLVRKSKYTSLIDNVYKVIGRNFCSSLENFIGSVKMHKYNLIMNESLYNRTNDDEEIDTVDAYKFLINYFSNVKIEEPSEGFKFLKENNLQPQRKLTELNENNLNLMKTYFEVKNEISSLYGENNFSDNEIIRFVVSITNNLKNSDNNPSASSKSFKYDESEIKEKIISALDELNNFRKNYKPNEFKFEELNSLNFDMLNFISYFTLDKLRRPVILIRLSYLNSINPDNNSLSPLIYKIIRYVLYTFNKAVDQMASNVDKYIVLIDAKNAPNLLNCELIHENLKKLFQFFSKFYPERLSEIYILNKGLNFKNIWKGVCSLIEELGVKNILNKVKLINNIREELSGILSEEKIELI